MKNIVLIILIIKLTSCSNEVKDVDLNEEEKENIESTWHNYWGQS